MNFDGRVCFTRNVLKGKSKRIYSDSEYRFTVGNAPVKGFIVKNLSSGLAFLLSCFGVLPSLSASTTVNWGTPTTISGDSDVSTAGTLDQAFNFVRLDTSTGPYGPATVNGVTFATFGPSPLNSPTVTVGNTTVASVGGSGGVESYNGYGSGSAPYSNLSAGYQQLLATGVYNDSGNLTLTLAGLTVGQEYLIEFFVNDTRETDRTENVTAGNTVSLAFNPSLSAGGLGQYVIGTFAADVSGSESITFAAGTPDQNTGIAASQINGFQLRTIPEPEISLLSLVGFVFFILSRLRRRSGSVG